MHIESEENKSKTVPDSLKCAALLRRAVEDIYRIIQIRNSKQACCSLQQRGSVGDNLWQMFLRAEKDMENEIADVVMEVCQGLLISLLLVNNFLGKQTAPKLGENNLSVRK